MENMKKLLLVKINKTDKNYNTKTLGRCLCLCNSSDISITNGIFDSDSDANPW